MRIASDGGRPSSARSRVRKRTATDDLEGPAHSLGVAGDVDGACDLVRTWLTAVAAAGRGA